MQLARLVPVVARESSPGGAEQHIERQAEVPEVDRGDPQALAYLVGIELKRARGKISQEKAASVLGVTRPVISYIEDGKQNPGPVKVRQLLEFYGCDQQLIERIVELSESYIGRDKWWADFNDVTPAWFATFVGLEGLAESEFVWEPLALPGMTMIPEYHEALLQNGLRIRPGEIAQIVELRNKRRERLTSTVNPLRLTTVIEQRTLDRMVGGPEVMRRQYKHLLELNRLDNVNLFVMPDSVAVHDGLDGEFILLDFAKALPIGYVESHDSAIYVQDQDQVRMYDLASKRMCEAATKALDNQSETVDQAIGRCLDRVAD